MIDFVTDAMMTDEGVALDSPLRPHYRSLAVSAIKAMHEPTQKMKETWMDDFDDWLSEKIEDEWHMWHIMIDTALKDNPLLATPKPVHTIFHKKDRHIAISMVTDE